MNRVRLTQCLQRAARLKPDGVATIDGERRRTWGELRDRVARLAGGLRGLGVGEGDRVALLAWNCDSYLEAYYAVLWGGAVLMPLNTRLSEPELKFQLEDTSARILLYGEEFAAVAQSLAASMPGQLRLVAIDGAGASAAVDYEDMVARSTPIDDAGRSGDDLAGIYFTGGTTGLPKGVMLTHENLHAMSRNLALMLGIGEGCVNLHSAPMFHVSAVGIFFTTMLLGQHVFSRKLDVDLLINLIEKHGVTHCFTVPTIIDRVARHPRALEADLSSLKLFGYGGSAMPVALVETLRRQFPHVGLAHGYGMTEMPAMTALVPADHFEGADVGRLRSVGRVMPEYELKVVDAEGRDVAAGEIGEIVGRGPNLMAGYWNRPQETAEALRGGWMHSQDAGYLDEAGYIYITDRFKDMIISGGENVYSIEVENVIYHHPAVAECAVIGVPDPKWGERVHALVVLKPGAAAPEFEAFRAFCRERIAGYKCPRSLEILDQPLPRSAAAGKVLKAELRAERKAGA